MTDLIAKYQQLLVDQGYQLDPAQNKAVVELQRVCSDMVQQAGPKHRLFNWRRAKPVTGLYLWGEVGRGKTWLMDLFYHNLPITKKKRMHLHHFMQLVHSKLRQYQGSKDPLALVAEEIAANTQVLCFDEFIVVDVADAMIMATLFSYLFARGICLVATSNVAPGKLYQDGLQYKQFLPFIELLDQYVAVINVDSGVDYRLHDGGQLTKFYSPLAGEADFMRSYLAKHRPNARLQAAAVSICGRKLDTIGHDDDLLWCSFDSLCSAPRGTADYMQLAQSYKLVLLSRVLPMSDDDNDKARRLIALVDEFYDQGVELVMSAQVPVDQLYTGSRLDFEIKRTVSRLKQMLS